MGFIYLFIAMLSFTVLGVSYKLSDRLKCNNRQVNLSLFGFSVISILIWGGSTGNLAPHKPAILLGLVMGVTLLIAVAGVRGAVAKGKISTSWTIMQLSLVIPVLASITYWHEVPSSRRCLGLVLVIVAIVLMGIDMGRRTE
jgi:drug/metabolite transporter (DMT)-like permease